MEQRLSLRAHYLACKKYAVTVESKFKMANKIHPAIGLPVLEDIP